MRRFFLITVVYIIEYKSWIAWYFTKSTFKGKLKAISLEKQHY